MACVCSHAPEDHRSESMECGGTIKTMVVDKTTPLGRKVELPCYCVMYEEGED